MTGRHRAERPPRPDGYWEAIDQILEEAPPITAERARDLRAILAGVAERAREERALAEAAER